MLKNTAWIKELVPAINELALADEHVFWFGLRRLKLRLPQDSKFHLREKKRGLIVESATNNMVLKIFLEPQYAALLREEIGTLKRLAETKFSTYVPRVLGHGDNWLRMDFHEAARPVDLQKDMRLILTPIALLHLESSALLSVEGWLAKAIERAKNFPSREIHSLLQAIKKEGEKFPDFPLVESLIHHDLHAQNILVDRKNHPVFIDWEGEIRSLTLIDYLDFGRREMKSDLNLREEPFRIYREFMGRDFSRGIDPRSIRLAYLIYAAERTLLLFEKRKVNRLSDHKGFEYRLLKSVE